MLVLETNDQGEPMKDNGKPATVEWLKSIGFRVDDDKISIVNGSGTAKVSCS